MSLITIFVASLLGSLHCAGMCGGFVAFYAGHAKQRLLAHFAYNVGRLSTYLVLGALAGMLGSKINSLGGLLGVQQIAAWITGLLLVFWGLKGLVSPNLSFLREYPSNWVIVKMKNLFVAILKVGPETNWIWRAFCIGTLSTLLPCGWLYSFGTVAAASADPLSGASIMAFFWLGTLPTMLSLGSLSQLFSSKLHAYLPRITSGLLIIAGLFAIFGHLGLPLGHSHHQHLPRLPLPISDH